MYGAILGDMIGAPYEFDRGSKTKDFPLFIKESCFTDDTVMTIAVAEALLETMGKSDNEIKAAVIKKSIRHFFFKAITSCSVLDYLLFYYFLYIM